MELKLEKRSEAKNLKGKSLVSKSFFAKNLGPVERMLWAIVGIAIMAIGFLKYDAQYKNGPGLLFVLIGFLIFLQAPMAWSPLYALQGRSTYEKNEEAD